MKKHYVLTIILALVATTAWGQVVSSPVSKASGGGGAEGATVTCSDGEFLVASSSTLVCSDGAVNPLLEGTLIARQDGGVAGTDEVQISHDGTETFITSQSGDVVIGSPDTGAFDLSIEKSGIEHFAISVDASQNSIIWQKTNSKAMYLDAATGSVIYIRPNNRTLAATFSGNGLDIADQGTRPTCDSSTRGNLWIEEGGAGVADTLQYCCKTAADSYTWSDPGTCS